MKGWRLARFMELSSLFFIVFCGVSGVIDVWAGRGWWWVNVGSVVLQLIVYRHWRGEVRRLRRLKAQRARLVAAMRDTQTEIGRQVFIASLQIAEVMGPVMRSVAEIERLERESQQS